MPDADLLTHLPLHVMPDPKRVVIRPFVPAEPFLPSGRSDRVADRALTLDPPELREELDRILSGLSGRHRDVDHILLRRFHEVNGTMIAHRAANHDQKRLIGAYFSEEYSFEAGAVLNPSIVTHPDQSGVAPGAVRFILSLRCVGEGDVSSINFRTGTWRADGTVTLDPPSALALAPGIETIADGSADDPMIRLSCDPSRDLSEIVIFPVTPHQRHGMEDLRLVRFVEDDGGVTFFGTYVAFSGSAIRQELLQTRDFATYDLAPIHGDAARDKDMALFPRRLNGRYAALGRGDHENIWFVRSDDLHLWTGGVRAITPQWPWEFVQIGTCGPPIELDQGWLVIIHGVGAVRNYCLGACLLDKDDPSRLLARTTSPLLRPSGAERDGYVPNVIYSCGSLLRDRTLLLPYAVADSFTAFVTVDVDRLLASMA